MAKSGSQSLQVAVILLSFLVIALGVGTYYFFNEWDKATKEVKQAQQERDTQSGAAQEAQDDKRAILKVVGLDPNMKVRTADGAVAKIEQALVAPLNSMPADQRNVLKAIEQLYTKLHTIKTDTVKAAETLVQVNNSVNAQEAKRIKDNEDRLKEIEAKYQELQQQYAGFKEKEKTLADQISGLNTDLASARKAKDDLEKELRTQLAQKETDISTLEKELSAARELIADIRGDKQQQFEHPDGHIVYINPSARTVWINLGRADNLKPQVKFNVYRQIASDVARTDDAGKVEAKKGEIEVTRVLGESLAEARIIKDTDLFVQGDLIHTPLWSPGRTEHIALAGDFDINGDGTLDNDLMQVLVRQGGATVDARLNDKGEIVGPGMTFETRYIVSGRPPSEPNLAAAYTNMQNEALKKGVRKIDMNQFLDLMGQSRLTNVKDLSAYSTDQFYDTPRDNDPSAPKDREFRRRTPPRGQGGGAF